MDGHHAHAGGLPAGIDGKIGVAISRRRSEPRLRAHRERERRPVPLRRRRRDVDAGQQRARSIRQRAFYYTHVFADPKNKDLVYVAERRHVPLDATAARRSRSSNSPRGDSHDLWIDPDDSNHVLHASDGGGDITFNATAADAHVVSAATIRPGSSITSSPRRTCRTHVCGAQQDDERRCACRATPAFGGRGGGGGGRGGATGAVQPGRRARTATSRPIRATRTSSTPAPTNGGGFLTKLNRRTGEAARGRARIRACSRAKSRRVIKERWQWTYPIIFSPVDPQRALHRLAARLEDDQRRPDAGTAISRDLTRHDPKTMGPSGGPITHDMNGPEVYAIDLLDRAVASARRQRHLDGIRRRRRAASRGRRQDVDERHAEGHAGLRPRQPDRRVGVRFGDGVRRGEAIRCSTTRRRTSSARTTSARRGRRSSPAFAATTTCTPCARIRRARACSTPATQHGVYVSYDDGDHWESLNLNLPDIPVSDLIVDRATTSRSRRTAAASTSSTTSSRCGSTTPATMASADPVLFRPAPANRAGDAAATIQYGLKQPAQNVRSRSSTRRVRSCARIPTRPAPAAAVAAAADAPADGANAGVPAAAPTRRQAVTPPAAAAEEAARRLRRRRREPGRALDSTRSPGICNTPARRRSRE